MQSRRVVVKRTTVSEIAKAVFPRAITVVLVACAFAIERKDLVS
jgi:hypothetical protein